MSKNYVVKEGDTLSSIAEELLHDPKRWKEIYEANGGIIDDPNVIQAGMTLKIPTEEPKGRTESHRKLT